MPAVQYWLVLDGGVDRLHQLHAGPLCVVDSEQQLHAVRSGLVLVRLGLLRVHCGERRLLCALGRPVHSEPVLVRHLPVVERAIGVHSVPARHCLVAARLALVLGVLVRVLWQCDRPRRVLQLPGGLDRHAAVALGGCDRVHVVRRRLVH